MSGPTVCIVGAGAAGLTLAHALVRRSYRVILIEGGDAEPPNELEDTLRVQLSGTPHRGAHEGRFRAWGGTTTRWGGQLWPWEPYEFEARPHLRTPGWPIDYATVAQYYDPALALLGVPRSIFGTGSRAKRLAAAGWDGSTLEPKFSVWLPWRRRNLGRTIGSSLRSHPDVTSLLHTTALEIVSDGTGARVIGVRARGADGADRLIHADIVVLAAGTIESTRLLLVSWPNIVRGTEPDWVGRCFMDHLSVRVGRFQPNDRRDFDRLFAPDFVSGFQRTPRFLVSRDIQCREGLLAAFAHWEWRLPDDSALLVLRNSLRAIQSGRFHELVSADLVATLAGVRDLVKWLTAYTLYRRRYFPERAEVYLRVDSEQTPDPESRLRLSNERDQFGLQRIILDWRISENERRTISRVTDLVAAELQRLGIGQLQRVPDPFDKQIPWGELKGDSFHMMGGTRMAAAPSAGVVDTDLRVFGTENLYIASSSVFPTGGMANPTLTLIALTLRLADHLSTRM